ncbi:methyltransferase family protein [Algirhabdus cladophorae]|uniref:methyltransferase family protein n=1 Tax=Algirhabdus cladophorae TaxID=3377108 RepID=UPI003B8480E6
MNDRSPSPLMRFVALALATLQPPPGGARIATALFYGALCHAVFALAVLSMILAMFFGMSMCLGRVPEPYAIFANAALIVQFPVVHSLLLTRKGGGLLSRLAPQRYGKALSTTTFAIIASIQLFALFALWTPSGTIWWQATGGAFVVICALYAASWLLLLWASVDAGAEVQSGALGWMSLMQNITPVFPDMPTRGLFRVIRQPIYAAFALTTWTVPVWTPDQLFLALGLTSYCVLAPLLKERRFAGRYGERFKNYRKKVPYMIPRLSGKQSR